jgi:hypothetical protein
MTMPFLLTFQLASIITPALAYPLMSLQEGLVRRMNAQPSSYAYLYPWLLVSTHRYWSCLPLILLGRLYLNRATHLGKLRRNMKYYLVCGRSNNAWISRALSGTLCRSCMPTPLGWILPLFDYGRVCPILCKNRWTSWGYVESRGWYQHMLPCVRSIPSVPLIVHRKNGDEVHPCQIEFALTQTKLYRTEFTNLQDCTTHQYDGKMGIAFWPLKENVLTCGLVWPGMIFIRNQGAQVGTCFFGPQKPRYITLSTMVNIEHVVHDSDIYEGLSPCQNSFNIEKSPFYLHHQKINLKDCRSQDGAVAWQVEQTCHL